jgi:MurNAc alpha-1-phosphate uridylyltransferase
MLPVVILAGGLATRLRPVTATVPKAMLEINGKPFVAHQLTLLQQQGITHVIFCLGFLGEQIVEYVSDGTKFNLHVQYSFDGETLLGTAGAIKKASSLLPQYFFLLNGDSYLPCDYSSVQAAFFKLNKLALMTVFNNQGRWDTSNVELAKQAIIKYDKKDHNERMQFIDYGLEIFSKEVFECLSPGEYCDLTEVYQRLIAQKQLAAFEVYERFYENGSFVGIEDLTSYLQLVLTI